MVASGPAAPALWEGTEGLAPQPVRDKSSESPGAEGEFPRGSYTPYGYLDNPYHCWALHQSGVLRSVPPIGFAWYYPAAPGGYFYDVLLEDVGLQGAVEPGQVRALAFGRDQVHAEDRDGRPADRHRGGDVGQRDALEQHVHVGRRVHRHPAVPHLAQRARVVGVAAHQGGHVEGHGKPRAAGPEQHLVPLVGLVRVAEPGELADRPRLTPVPGGVQAAGERELPRPADPLEPGHHRAGRRPVDRVNLEAGQRGEVRFALGRLVEPALPALPARVRARVSLTSACASP